jgi:hypothetical protein
MYLAADGLTVEAFADMRPSERGREANRATRRLGWRSVFAFFDHRSGPETPK